jgi:hypothetical protein
MAAYGRSAASAENGAYDLEFDYDEELLTDDE